MSTTADQLLDGVMNASEEGSSVVNGDVSICLIVDESTRTIFNTDDKELILGVAGDKYAERIYFRCPQYVYNQNGESIDLDSPTTKIYIDYKNAVNEPYIQECAKHGVEDGLYSCSWLISDKVTVKDGTVIFNICVKDEPSHFRITNEWLSMRFVTDSNGSYGDSIQKLAAYMYSEHGAISERNIVETLTLEGDDKRYMGITVGPTISGTPFDTIYIYDQNDKTLYTISSNTPFAGNPSQIEYTTLDLYDPAMQHFVLSEWHTTTFKAKVLPAVDVSSKTPEVITSDTITSAAIIDAMNSYEDAVDGYAENLATLNESLGDVNAYIDGQVNETVNNTINSYIIDVNEHVNGGVVSYTANFDLDLIDFGNINNYKCVIDRDTDNQKILSLVKYAYNGTVYMLFFSNTEISFKIQWTDGGGNIMIIPYDAAIPTAHSIYQTTVDQENDDDSDYPLLVSSDYSSYMDQELVNTGICRTTQLTFNPRRGVLVAQQFNEGGKSLSEKYVSKELYLALLARVEQIERDLVGQ